MAHDHPHPHAGTASALASPFALSAWKRLIAAGAAAALLWFIVGWALSWI